MSKQSKTTHSLCLKIIEEILLYIPTTTKGKQTIKTTNIVQVLLPQKHREELIIKCLPCNRIFIGMVAYKKHLISEKCLKQYKIKEKL